MRVAYQDCFHLIEPLLAKVEKPSRYIDHEWGTLSKADADLIENFKKLRLPAIAVVNKVDTLEKKEEMRAWLCAVARYG